jgi:[acyl-carrier-protein] S-malonyltransferase
MLLPWLDLPGSRERVDAWSALTGLDLLALGTTGTDADIRDTAVAQPLLTAAALLSAQALVGTGRPGVVCGHSIGEIPALAVAGVVTADEAVTLAAERGAAMASAAAERPTGMAAVLGGRPDEVAAATERLGLAVATVNVETVLDGRALLDRLVAQLTGPVRFDLCLRTLADLGATGVVEVAPGGTLAALAKRALPAVPVVPLRSAEDLPAAQALRVPVGTPA